MRLYSKEISALYATFRDVFARREFLDGAMEFYRQGKLDDEHLLRYVADYYTDNVLKSADMTSSEAAIEIDDFLNAHSIRPLPAIKQRILSHFGAGSSATLSL